jgi:hypothetical protein
MEKQKCDMCKTRNSELTEYCPVSLLMNQRVKWNYCRPCYLKDLDNAKIVKEKLGVDFDNVINEIKGC